MNGLALMTNMFHFNEGEINFEDCGRDNGFCHWYARDLMEWLDYKSWYSFKKAINKAMAACAVLNISIPDNFKQIKREINGKEEEDFCLSRFACYITTMNSDSSIPNVAKAQIYFAKVTEAFRQYIQELEDYERVNIRHEISDHEKSLSGVAKEAGVEQYPFFQNKGYLGMYNMNLRELKDWKGIPSSRSPLDFMGKEELAANLFRLTQTEAKIRNEGIRGQGPLEVTAYQVGRKVRKTMEEISGTLPEDLPKAQDIKLVQKDLKTAHKKLSQKNLPKSSTKRKEE